MKYTAPYGDNTTAISEDQRLKMTTTMMVRDEGRVDKIGLRNNMCRKSNKRMKRIRKFENNSTYCFAFHPTLLLDLCTTCVFSSSHLLKLPTAEFSLEKKLQQNRTNHPMSIFYTLF